MITATGKIFLNSLKIFFNFVLFCNFSIIYKTCYMKNHRCGKGSCECVCLACEKDDDGDDAALLESVAKCARMLEKNNGDSNGAEQVMP